VRLLPVARSLLSGSSSPGRAKAPFLFSHSGKTVSAGAYGGAREGVADVIVEACRLLSTAGRHSSSEPSLSEE
jgi:hypothetical protein